MPCGVVQVLLLARALLRFGAYPDAARIRALVRPVCALLDSVDDTTRARGAATGGAGALGMPVAAQSPGLAGSARPAGGGEGEGNSADEERYTVTEETATIIQSKARARGRQRGVLCRESAIETSLCVLHRLLVACCSLTRVAQVVMCEILLLLADYRCDTRLTQFLSGFKFRNAGESPPSSGRLGLPRSFVKRARAARSARRKIAPDADMGYQAVVAATGEVASQDQINAFTAVFEPEPYVWEERV